MRHLAAFLKGRGLQPELQTLQPNRANLIARVRGRQSEGGLVLSGHMDVVHPGETAWDCDPFGADLVDGRLIGRGSADMKGGVAAMATAMAELMEEGFEPASDLVLAITCGEEADTAGARLMADRGSLAGCASIVVGEPTGLDVYIAEKGVLWVRIIAHGHTAHGSMPHLGVNAVAYMAEVVNRLGRLSFPHAPHSVLGPPTVSVNAISGGVKVNVVPDRCETSIDMRLIPGQEAESVLQTLRDLLDEAVNATGLRVSTEVQVLQNLPAVETSPDASVVKAVVDAARHVRGSEPSVGGISYGTDGAVLAPSVGADLVIFGPGDPKQAHQPNEYVEVSELLAAKTAYKEMARALLT